MSDWITSSPELSDEDQARVQAVISSGYNDVERRPFRPMLMLLLVIGSVTFFSGLSWLIAWHYGVL